MAQGTAGRMAAAPRTGQAIALLDVSYIFKNHTRFKAMMADIQTDVERAGTQMKTERDTVKSLSEQLRDFRPGSANYKQLEEQVATRTSQLQVQLQLQRKEFLQREAKVYHTIYQEVQQEVEYYASSAGIAMVLRFNGDPVNQDKPDDVLRGINSQVVWSAKGLDITPVILERLNQRAGGSRATVGDQRSTRPGVPFNR